MTKFERFTRYILTSFNDIGIEAKKLVGDEGFEFIRKDDLAEMIEGFEDQTVLFVDDRPGVARGMKALLGIKNVVHSFGSVQEALDKVPSLQVFFDYVISDYNLRHKEWDGIQLLGWLRSVLPHDTQDYPNK